MMHAVNAVMVKCCYCM